VTSYKVNWSKTALQALATTYLNAVNRRAVTQAQARADQLLAQSPNSCGKHFSEGLYRLAVPPLVLTYTIDDDRRVVEVTSLYAST
jgi:mRNA-degrading endonuclease RelE of RelBE toxin-antitoxin system